MIDTSNIVTEALSGALEKKAFLTFIPPAEPPAVPEKSFLAEMDFTGPSKGTIQLLAGAELCRELAENICGIEQVEENVFVDALKELLNVTAGLLLPMLDSALMDAFDVTVPRATSFEMGAQWEQFIEQDDVIVLDVENLPIAVRLIIQD